MESFKVIVIKSGMQIEQCIPKIFSTLEGPMLFEVPRSPHCFRVEKLMLNKIEIPDVNVLLAHAGWLLTKSGKFIWCFNDGQEVIEVSNSIDTIPDIIIACSNHGYFLDREPHIQELSAEQQLPDISQQIPVSTSFFYRVNPRVSVPPIWNYDPLQNSLEQLNVTVDDRGLIKRGKLLEYYEM